VRGKNKKRNSYAINISAGRTLPPRKIPPFFYGLFLKDFSTIPAEDTFLRNQFLRTTV
jgi:hypothetical protein